MAETVHCSRCGRDAGALARNPIPGPEGAEIRRRVCAECWEEWTRMEVMVINELRLNFMDPEAQATLSQHMREFLGLGAPESPADAG
ncbi:MAG: oxidative damage protection protein [Acidobacteria bacterium]|nr:oxidative damage protection protein [Acidobacteriota bacterium]